MDPTTAQTPETPPASRVIAAFVALGVSLRLARFALNYPLWGDEAFLAVNFLDRDFLGLLGPLEYGQVAPIGFLWAELAAVKLLGFREWSLRLFPLLCGVASVPLFARASGLLLEGRARLLALAVFAVAFHPIRHASEVKPYATDLLVALALLTPALAFLRDPSRPRSLWTLAALAAPALAFSHPSVFVAGGIGLVLIPSVWRSADSRVRVAFLAYGAAVSLTFLGLFASLTRSQEVVLPGLRAYWADSFPPRTGPLALLRWLAEIHTGSMFAYPGGGRRGASAPALALFLVGAFALARSQRRAALAVCLAPFGLTLLAAALRRYPYGGEARIAQFLAPSICLLVGLGAARLLDGLPRPRLRQRATVATLALLTTAGIAPLLAAAAHPYRMPYDARARDFARDFWPALGQNAEIACACRDFGLAERGSPRFRTSVYLCNQAIHSPQRRNRPQGHTGPRWDAITSEHPLLVVLPHELRPESPEALAWLVDMGQRFERKERRDQIIDMAGPGDPPRLERITVFEFSPRQPPAVARFASPGKGGSR